MLYAIAVVLSFDESMQAQIDGGEELAAYIVFWSQAMPWVGYIAYQTEGLINYYRIIKDNWHECMATEQVPIDPRM